MERILRRPRLYWVRKLFLEGTTERSGVGKRFVEIARILDLFAFQDGAAVEAFDILGFVVFGDQALALVGAGWFSHYRKPFLELLHYNIAAGRLRRYKQS
jgi:hypothetical protein